MSLESGFSVPIAYTDLPPAESLLQSFDNLQQLTTAIDNIFARLTSRINEERSRIGSIVKRVNVATAKVEQVAKNPGKVCTVFSAARFPGSETLPNYPSLVKDRELDKPVSGQSASSEFPTPAPLVRNSYKLTQELRAQRAAATDLTDLFHTLSAASATRAERVVEADGTEGLGRIPTGLQSVSNLILFNSSENPYQKYESINNLEGVGGHDRETGAKALFSAPQTLVDGTELPTFVGPQFDYKPDLGAVPVFQLPQNLPLNRLADISFDGALTSIAPSTTALVNLPTFTFEGFATTTRTRAPVVQTNLPTLTHVGPTGEIIPPPSVPATTAPPPPPAAGMPPPPPPGAAMPPPPPPSASNLPPPPPAASNLPPPPPAASKMPPPPPGGSSVPPPPPAGSSSLPPPPSRSTDEVAAVASRDSLFASIRLGTQLKKAVTVDQSAPVVSKSSGPAPLSGLSVAEQAAAAAARRASQPKITPVAPADDPEDKMKDIRKNIAMRAGLISGRDIEPVAADPLEAQRKVMQDKLLKIRAAVQQPDDDGWE